MIQQSPGNNKPGSRPKIKHKPGYIIVGPRHIPMNRHDKTRLPKALAKFLAQARLNHVKDPRKPRGVRYPLTTMLRTLLTSLVCGCTGLRDSRTLQHNLSPTARTLFAATKPISNTALRYFLTKFQPHALRPLLRQTAHQAHATKAIRRDDFPYGVVAVDGKQTHTRIHDNTLTQRRRGKAYLRTITCCLTSSKLKPCLDCVPLMPRQNEQSAFPQVFDDLGKHFGRWFQLITYDAGACSEDNAALVNRTKRGYVFALKNNQPTLFEEAKRLLGNLPPSSCQAQDTDCARGSGPCRAIHGGPMLTL